MQANRRRGWLRVVAVAVVALLAVGGGLTGPVATADADDVVIDAFASQEMEVEIAIPGSAFPYTSSLHSSGSSADILGGYRDVCLSVSAGNSGAKSNWRVDATNHNISLAQADTVKSVATIQWDGNDGSCTLAPTGMSAVDLTNSGANNGILLRIVGSDGLGVSLRVRLYTDGSNWKERTVTHQGTVAAPNAVDVVMPFSTFSGGAGTLNAASVRAVELQIDATANAGADLTIGLFLAATRYDYGDLPLGGVVAGYPEAVLNARHIIGGMRLGASVDGESTHKSSRDANGDDITDTDDEDGVTRRNRFGAVPSDPPNWQAGSNGGAVRVAATGCSDNDAGACYVVGWVDWNNDGDFDDASELIVEDYHYVDTLGTNYNFYIPIGTSFTDARYYARFRTCPGNTFNPACSTPTATNVDNGEIEDYAWDWGSPPLAAGLGSFQAVARGRAVQLSWQTVSELEMVGFNLYRSEAVDGEYVQLNEGLIPAERLGQAEGQTYAWLDRDVARGRTYYYAIEAVQTGSQAASLEPVEATVPSFLLYLPRILGR